MNVDTDILSRNGSGLSVTFDTVMDQTSVKKSKLKLTDVTTGSVSFLFDLEVDSANFLDITFDGQGKSMTVKLADSITTTTVGYKDFGQLTEGHRYQVELVSTQSKDVGGNLLFYRQEEAIFTFATRTSTVSSGIYPKIESTSPVDGATNV